MSKHTPVRSITVLFIFYVSLLLAGCGGGGSDNSSTQGDSASDSAVSIEASTVQGEGPLTVKFSAESDDLILGAAWDFGDGVKAVPVNPESSVTHTYTEDGTYTVTLNATLNSGGPHTDTIKITVGTGITQVEIEASVTEGDVPLPVVFNAVSDDTILSASWDFGDGATADPINPNSSVSHTYTENGTYTVTLNAELLSSGPQTSTIQITATGQPVIPDVDLIVSSFAIDTEVTPLGLETVSAIIQNIGTEALTGSGFINVGYYLSTDNVITVDDIYIGDTSIFIGDSFTQNQVPFGFEKLSPGENYQYNHQLAVMGNTPPGTYYAGVIVDYIDYYEWYTFPRATDTIEYIFPVHSIVTESDETNNVRLLTAHQVLVTNAACPEDAYEDDDSSATATPITLGESQPHNFCTDNSDWLTFDAVQGGVYKITTSALGTEADTQLILYDRDATSILLMDDNLGNANLDILKETKDLLFDFPPIPRSEIVWEAEFDGTYFIKVRTTVCDEDLDTYCDGGTVTDEDEGDIIIVDSPDGVGLNTEYTITLQ
ncbi:MAG TPA: hypothetical protein DDW55_06060 [Gammaproteobacteria bacterium]|nr:hypothetical protein [Gammaproteobacteria bacterium]